METINLTEKELELLRDLVEEALNETSPTPDETMLSLCKKIGSGEDIMNWINRMLNQTDNNMK